MSAGSSLIILAACSALGLLYRYLEPAIRRWVKSRLPHKSSGLPAEPPLWTRKRIETTLSPATWQRQSYEDFRAAMLATDPVPFPCVYATKGFKASEHRYLFLSSPDPNNKPNMRLLASGLREYVEAATAQTLGPLNALTVLFPRPDSPASKNEKHPLSTLEDYHANLWNLLNHLARMDTSPWPADIPPNTSDPLWRFSFAGQAVFVAAMTPAHQARRSRFCGCYALVLQLADNFDVVFATPARKAGAIGKVRGLLREFDLVGISPELKDYGDKEGREAKQYFLMDGDEGVGSPFEVLGK